MTSDDFLRELEVEVEADLTLAESSSPEQDVVLPVEEWRYDPTDVQREEAGLQNLLGAVQAMEESE
ncbi:hypothetical protein EV646_112220 [Kribbella antiqua]|uniref:Uncharacterized protein n=1 Tax=Kribbella antiqua TaxID=2512217 RepID=A0A4R2IG08_9ACTN|nr:hypothetical protein [Kribbella antiqua]TCO43643.1 hypothetical protein EV646_112220 [Kribbella antiqua]